MNTRIVVIKMLKRIINHLEEFRAKVLYRNYKPETVWDMDKHTSWGHRISWMDFQKRRISGHTTPRPKDGDELRSTMQSGKVARFEIVKVEYCRDPSDMWFAEVSDIGYMTQVDTIR